MKRNLSDLKIKSINELTIPNQLQGYVHLIDWLINNQLDDSSICELFKLFDNYSIKSDIIESLLYTISRAFPNRRSLLSNIGEMMQNRKIIKTFSIFEDYYKECETQTIVKSIIMDKIDEIVVEIEKEAFDINQELILAGIGKLTLIDIACMAQKTVSHF